MSGSWDGRQLREALASGAQLLEENAESVNALNVFPVPDGDTGTNMALTLGGALADVPPDPSCAVVADQVRHWTMMRGRGNSGIILSQVFRGMAQALAGHQRMGPAELAASLRQATAAAYKAVLKPVEGTMLTVLREASEAAHAAGQSASIHEVLEAATGAARAAVARTPQLLKTLRDAGVVDAGGQGLVLLLEGMLRYARHTTGAGRHDQVETLHAPGEASERGRTPAAGTAHPAPAYGYCTSFVLRGAGLQPDELRAGLAALGDSLVVAGDEQAVKVHLHTQQPGEALSYALARGALDAIEIANMDLQHESFAAHRQAGAEGEPAAPEPAEDTRVGVVAVSSGAGFAAIFRSLHAGAVLDGGPTVNPSTRDLLAAIGRLPQREVIVLPNGANAVMAARQAAELSGRAAVVLPTRSMAQGVAALTGFGYQAGLEENQASMAAAVARVRTAEVTAAVREATVGGLSVRAGQYIGLLDGALVAAGDDRDTLIDELAERMQLHDAELVTVYYGGQAGRDEAESVAARIGARYQGLAIEVHEGGQPLYDFSISAE